MTHRLVIAVLLTAAVVAAAPSVAPAQEIKAGGYTMLDFPIGDWGEVAGFGLGLDGSTLVRRASRRSASMRSNLGVLYNFSRTQDVPQANLGPNSALALETKNWSLIFGLGPEFSRPSEGLAPFIYGTVGFQTFWSSSTLSGTAGGSPYESKFGDSRIAFAWTAGGGFRRPIGGGVMGELSVEYRAGGDHKYVLPGEVTNTGTQVFADRKLRSSDQIVVRFGTVMSDY
jgi:hypothetical protein